MARPYRSLSTLILCALATVAFPDRNPTAPPTPPPSARPPSIQWETDFGEAMARAKKENKVVVAALNMDGERANDTMVTVHYKDPLVVQLSKHTINLFCSASTHGKKCSRVSGVSCPQHGEIDKRVRLDILKAKPEEWIVAPQHVFISPDGKILSSVPYYVTVGELEWMWVDGIRRLDKDFAWELGDRARAPRRMKLSKTQTEKVDKTPPTREQVKQMLKEIKKGFGSYYEAAQKLPVLVRDKGETVRTFTKRLLDAFETSPAQRASILVIIGDNSPGSWWNVVAPYLANEDERVRLAAAWALEKLAEKKALKVLRARWKKESSVAVKGRLLRAMAACAPTNRSVLAMPTKVLTSGAPEDLRLHATLAGAVLEDRDAVTATLTTALADDSPKVRATAAYAIAMRRDREMRPALEKTRKAESDAFALRWMQEAEKVLEGADLEAFEEFLAAVFENKK